MKRLKKSSAKSSIRKSRKKDRYKRRNPYKRSELSRRSQAWRRRKLRLKKLLMLMLRTSSHPELGFSTKKRKLRRLRYSLSLYTTALFAPTARTNTESSAFATSASIATASTSARNAKTQSITSTPSSRWSSQTSASKRMSFSKGTGKKSIQKSFHLATMCPLFPSRRQTGSWTHRRQW